MPCYCCWEQNLWPYPTLTLTNLSCLLQRTIFTTYHATISCRLLKLVIRYFFLKCTLGVVVDICLYVFYVHKLVVKEPETSFVLMLQPREHQTRPSDIVYTENEQDFYFPHPGCPECIKYIQ